MKKINLLLLSLLMCFVISNTAYAEEEYTIIDSSFSKSTAAKFSLDTNIVVSLDGLDGGENIYCKFTTPAKEGTFELFVKGINNSTNFNYHIEDALGENFGGYNSIYSGDSRYQSWYFNPSTTYYLVFTNTYSWQDTNSGNIKFHINYNYDLGGNSQEEATSISCDKLYTSEIYGEIDTDWYKFNTGSYTDFEIFAKNIGGESDPCSEAVDSYSSCYTYFAILNEIGETLCSDKLYLLDEYITTLNLHTNTTYYVKLYHCQSYACDTCFTDAYQFNISPVRTPLSSTSIKLSATSYTYDGKAKTPAVTVTYAGKTLTKGTDYTVAYSNNTATGIGKVTITGKGNYKGTVTKTFTIKPKKLTGLKQSWRTTSSVTLTWTALTGVSGYDIYRKDTANGSFKYVGSTTNTKYINSGLTAGKTYYYVVRGYKKSGTTKVSGANSDVITTTTTPGKVTGVKQTEYSSYYVTLSWNKLNGATGYYIYRKDSANGSFKYIGTTTSTSYTNKSLPSGKNYYYVVVGYKKLGSTIIKGANSATLQATTRPTVPTLKGTAGTKNVSLTWSKVSGATGYEVYMSTSKNGTYSKIATIGATSSKIATIGSTSITYKKTALTAGKTYYFKVRSYTTGASGKKVYSYTYSSVVAVKAK